MIEVVVGVVVEMEMIEIDKITEIIVVTLEEIGQHRSIEKRTWRNRPDTCTTIQLRRPQLLRRPTPPSCPAMEH